MSEGDNNMVEQDLAEQSAAPDAPEHTGDPLLNLIMDFAANDLCFPITLYVNGMAVSGTICSYREYLKRTIEKLDGSGAEAFWEKLQELELKEPEPSPDDPVRDHKNVHLYDAQIMSTSPAIPSEPYVFRFRQSAITGWSFGKLVKK